MEDFRKAVESERKYLLSLKKKGEKIIKDLETLDLKNLERVKEYLDRRIVELTNNN